MPERAVSATSTARKRVADAARDCLERMARIGNAPSGLGAPAPVGVKAVERPDARTRLYTAEWDRASKTFKAENPLCIGCKAVGETALTEVTDHIVPHHGIRSLFWTKANWQPCCQWHHNNVKPVLERRFEAGQATVVDLHLDSEMARSVTRALRGGGSDSS